MGRATTFGYDADMRLAGIDYPAGTPDVNYAYDAASNLVASGKDRFVVDGVKTV